MRKIAAAFAVALTLPAVAHSQKKVLTQADWDKWKSINAPALSNDGKWAVYTLIPQVGDGELVVRATSGTTEYRVPRGFLGRPISLVVCAVLRAAEPKRVILSVQRRRLRRSRRTVGS